MQGTEGKFGQMSIKILKSKINFRDKNYQKKKILKRKTKEKISPNKNVHKKTSLKKIQ